jgi:hypothetical protein
MRCGDTTGNAQTKVEPESPDVFFGHVKRKNPEEKLPAEK